MTGVLLAAVLGILFGGGTFLILRQDLIRIVWGLIIISQAANMYIIGMGLFDGSAPVLAHGGHATVTDPLVQALVLTAIVIGFGTTAFLLVLVYRVYEEYGTVAMSELEGDAV